MKKEFMQEAIELAKQGMQQGKGGPFGAVIVKDNKIIGRGNNNVLANFDPTAHAEVMAIRDACKSLGNFSLEGCDIYTSCEPCPMCLTAMYWARVKNIYYGATREDAKAAGFDDAFFYEELTKTPEQRRVPMHSLLHDEAAVGFQQWIAKPDKTPY